MKTVLITGGAGFLGTNLSLRLHEMGHRVLCLDNLQTGYRENIASLEESDRFVFIEHDIIQPIEIDEEIDWIFNLASAASPPRYQKDPIHTMKTGTIGVMNVLDLATKKNAVVMQASTSEVYGDPTVHPQPETYLGNVNTIGPRACYDEGKRAAEALCFDYHRMHKTKVKVVRIFNTYGPHMDPEDGRVISNFIMQALRGEDITIYGEGEQTRSFCFVSDLIDAFLKMMDTPDDILGPINTGNPQEITIKELAEQIIELTGSSSQLVYKPLPKDDPTRRRPDITKAGEVLGWQPSVDRKEGLAKTIEYYKTRI